MQNPSGLIIVAIGLFSMLGGVLNWEWFMNHRKAAFIAAIFTRTGARIFYALLGAALIAWGAFMAAGLSEDIWARG